MSTSRDDFAIAIRSALLQRGARQKFSLFFLICFSILIFFLDSFPSKFMDGLRATLNDGIYRVSSVSTSPIKFVSIINDKIKKHISIYNENELLKSEVEALRNKNFNVEFLTNENKKLQQIVESEVSENENAILAKVLLDRVKNPDAKSADLNVARQFLKDNNIDAVPVKDSPLEQLMKELPFNEEKSVIKN